MIFLYFFNRKECVKLSCRPMIVLQILISTILVASTSEPFYRTPDSTYSSGTISKPGLITRIIEEEWVQLQVNGQTGWALRNQIKLPEDFGAEFGQALSRNTLTLREKPNSQGRPLATIPKLESIRVLNFAISPNPNQTWVRVEWGKKTGFVELHSLFTSADLATRARINGEWNDVLYHNDGWLETFRQKRFGVAEADMFELSQRALISQPTVKLMIEPRRDSAVVTTVSGLETYSIADSTIVKWGETKAKNHGAVWVRIRESLPTPATRAGNEYLTNDILSRPLFDMATSRANPHVMVVSAQGVFLTHDGQKWKKLKEFGDSNYPVAFSGDGTLFVGQHQSDNLGETFTPFLKWDNVTHVIRSGLQSVPSQMRIVDIRNRDDDKSLLIELDVGRKRIVQLSTGDKGTTWAFEGERGSCSSSVSALNCHRQATSIH